MTEWVKVEWGNAETYPPERTHVDMRRWMVDRWMGTTGETYRIDGDPLTTSVDGRNWWAHADEGLVPDVGEHGIVDTIFWREQPPGGKEPRRK